MKSAVTPLVLTHLSPSDRGPVLARAGFLVRVSLVGQAVCCDLLMFTMYIYIYIHVIHMYIYTHTYN